MLTRTRIFKAVCAVALLSALAVPTVTAATRWTGADYCAAQNGKGDWALVGGASCNPAPTTQANAAWKQALILDFKGLKTTNAYTRKVVEHYASLRAMLTELTANHASKGWMYVANKKGNGDLVYLMVKKASCAGSSSWYLAPACK